jgi:hypothetical protein
MSADCVSRVSVVDVVVEVGDWEHECCGEAIERNQLVDFQCIRYTDSASRPNSGCTDG